MRYRCGILLWLIIAGAVGSASQQAPAGAPSAETLIGTWTGTWDAAGSNGGGFELTIEKDTAGAVAGRVSVTGEPAYQATLSALTFDGRKLSARYDFPPDPSGEILLTATVEGNQAAGTWSLRAKAGGEEAATGGWKLARK
ncbi:MAG: hypothetical protein ABJC89_09590 [Acidobacteriota bacterium]